jgi:hypothetical protein
MWDISKEYRSVVIKKRIILATSILLLSGQVSVALIPLFCGKNLTAQFPMGVGEFWVTSFRALNEVTLTQLGATIDPKSISGFAWSIYTNDVELPKILVLEEIDITFADVGIPNPRHRLAFRHGTGRVGRIWQAQEGGLTGYRAPPQFFSFLNPMPDETGKF